MIRHNDEFKVEIREHMRGGAGQVVVTNFVDKEELHNNARLFGQITLEPGCEIGVHEHNGESEIFFFEEGSGIYIDNGTELNIKAGDVAICGPGESHGVINNTESTLKFVALIVLK